MLLSQLPLEYRRRISLPNANRLSLTFYVICAPAADPDILSRMSLRPIPAFSSAKYHEEHCTGR